MPNKAEQSREVLIGLGVLCQWCLGRNPPHYCEDCGPNRKRSAASLRHVYTAYYDDGRHLCLAHFMEREEARLREAVNAVNNGTLHEYYRPSKTRSR